MIINQIKSLFQSDEDVFVKANTFYSFSPVKFFLLILGACFILFCRRPEALLEPQLFAEDGAIFFKDAYELSFWSSIFKTYAGYFHVIPRILAEFASLFPVRYVPVLYNSFSLMIAAVSCCWIWLPHFRHLIRSDLLRLLLVLMLLLSPNQEALAKLSYIQWYILLWLTLCCFMLPIRNRLVLVSLTVVIILSVWTSAISFILLPVWMLRLCFVEPFQKSMVAAILTSSLALLAAAYFINSTADSTGEGITNIQLLFNHMMKGLFHAILYKVICSGILGPKITFSIFTEGWKYIYAASLLLIAIIFIFYSFTKKRMLAFMLINIYIATASVFFFIFRTDFVLSFIQGEGVLLHDRYFFLGTSLFILMLFTIASHYFQESTIAKWKGILPGFILLLWASFYVTDFQMQWTPINFGWPHYARQIETDENIAALQGQTYNLKIPINPYPWTIDLRIGPRER